METAIGAEGKTNPARLCSILECRSGSIRFRFYRAAPSRARAPRKREPCPDLAERRCPRRVAQINKPAKQYGAWARYQLRTSYTTATGGRSEEQGVESPALTGKVNQKKREHVTRVPVEEFVAPPDNPEEHRH